jgi:hypothetical protein
MEQFFRVTRGVVCRVEDMKTKQGAVLRRYIESNNRTKASSQYHVRKCGLCKNIILLVSLPMFRDNNSNCWGGFDFL